MLDDSIRQIILKNSKIPEKYYNKRMNKPFINSSLNKDKEVHQHLYNDYFINSNWIKQGKNLLIWGSNCGSGKTQWASKIAQKYIMTSLDHFDNEPYGLVLRSFENQQAYCPVKFISFTGFISMIKENLNFPSQNFYTELDALKCADLVIWDDVLNDYRELPASVWEALYSIIDTRAGVKSNIFTSNRDPALWQECLGAEIVSRILQKCEVVKFQNVDLRQAEL